MARHFVRLKLALLRGALATLGVRTKVAFAITYLWATCAGVVAAVGLAAARGASDADFRTLVSVVLGLLFLGWTFLPVLTVAVENSLDVDRLSLLPLGPRDMMPGLLLATMAGFGGLFTVLVLAGAVIQAAPLSPGALVTAAAFALGFAVSVAASRVVSTALSAATRKRRWRDLALTVVPLMYLALQLGVRVYSPGRGAWRVFGRVFLVLPTAPSAVAVVAAREGRWLVALAGLALSALVLVLLLRLWWAAIDRVLTTAIESGGPASTGAVVGLFPRWARWLPANRVGAVAAKELRLQWRDPQRRASLISAAFFAVLPLLSIRTAGGLGRGTVLFAVAPTAVFGLSALNQFAYDGPRYWMHVAAGDDLRGDLLGKNLAAAVVTLPVTLVVAVTLAALSGGWVYVVPVLALAVEALGVQLGIGNVSSVLAPVPAPDSRSSPWANNSAQGAQVFASGLLAMLVTAALIGPFVGLTAVAARSPWVVVVMAVEAGVGWGLWRAGLGIAMRRSAGRQAELLEALSRARGT